jgi:two-component system KDP operon response regulator KdpE
MRKLIRANLEAYGFEVRSAVNGRHGLHTVSEGEPDLILLDIEVPDAQLDHLVARLKGQVVRQVPIIVLVAEPPAGRKTEEAAEIRYLLKPFGVPTLLEQVRAALQASPTEGRSAIQDA